MRMALIFLAAIIASPAVAQFTLQNSNTTADLRGIDNVGNGVVWASGTNGTVLRSEDGGYLWQTCRVPAGTEHLDFRGIQAFDANTAIVMSSGKGSLSRLYKTTDGCRKWKLIFRNPDRDGFWDAINFDHGRSGWVLGDSVKGMFVLFASRDSGLSWTRQKNKGLKVQQNEQAAFAASNSSVTALEGSVSFASGGRGGAFVYSIVETEICLDDCSPEELNLDGHRDKWIRQPVPIGNNTDSSGVFSLGDFRGPMSIALLRSVQSGGLNGVYVAVGGDYLNPDDSTAIAAWFDKVNNRWTAAQTQPHGFRSAVAYSSDNKTWIAVGPNGTDVSIDDGRNWHAVHPSAALHEAPDADLHWNALSLPYVVGSNGRIGKVDEAALKR